MFEDSMLPYASPYDLLLEIVDKQLNSEVAACVLEPTSLLEGNLVLGGALLLRRKGVRKSLELAGEAVSYTDDDDALGNEGVPLRSLYVAEYFADEALGVALAVGAPLLVEEGVRDRAGGVAVELDADAIAAVRSDGGDEENRVEDRGSLSFEDHVPPLRPADGSRLSIEGFSCFKKLF